MRTVLDACVVRARGTHWAHLAGMGVGEEGIWGGCLLTARVLGPQADNLPTQESSPAERLVIKLLYPDEQ